MSVKPVPTKSLYIGAAGEHYVISECFRHNREAFKLPIDKGFDLVVTRAYIHLADSPVPAEEGEKLDETPIYLQVKSRQVSLAIPEDNKVRPQWEGAFVIKLADLDLICKTKNSALVCVLFFENFSELLQSRTTVAWWMGAEYVNRIRRSGHFIDKNSDGVLELWMRYCAPAAESSHRQNAYVSLFKQCRSAGAKIGELSSGELLPKELYSFSFDGFI